MHVCVQGLKISRMIGDSCLNDKGDYDYGRPYYEKQIKKLLRRLAYL